MEWHSVALTALLVVEYGLKVVAVGIVPENRRPSSSQVWLLLILFIPLVGFPLYLLIGSPYVRGRRARIQQEANKALAEHAEPDARIAATAAPDPALTGLLTMNHRLTGLPCVTGTNRGLIADTPAFYAAMGASVDQATDFVHVEFYIMAWDETTDVLFAALARAVERGVVVRLLLDHLGSRGYPGWRHLQRRLDQAGIEWHLMMPLLPLRGRWRRPDLRNHRKLLVVDGREAYVGSHNVIEPSYASRRNQRIGRRWRDLSMGVSGRIVSQVEAVFATDWYIETGERLQPAVHAPVVSELALGGSGNAMQLVPSGPGFPTEPNRQQFVHLIHLATEHVSITSPYFVPDESLLTAIIGAAQRGVEVELFVGEQADQFLVGHAQRSYYRVLLEAGVRIWLYPAPQVLHAKYLTIDGRLGLIGSSNMDPRSFALDYEIMLLAFGGDVVTDLQQVDQEHRDASTLLTLEQWAKLPWWSRYVDNVCKLTSALM